jgi:cytochrome c oxidase assembly protein subunit 15
MIWLFGICILTGATVIVGGATRLTDSGLSITEWKPLLGALPPLNHSEWLESFHLYQKIPQFTRVYPHMSLEEYKSIFYWEYLHRNLGRLIGLFFFFPFLFFLVKRALTRPFIYKLLFGLLLGGAQGVLGWYMVKSGLSERVTVSHFRLAAHLGLAFIIFAYFWKLLIKLMPQNGFFLRTNKSIRRWIRALVSILFVQIIWGAFVAGLRAGYIYPTFPKMGEEWFPFGGLAYEPVLINFIKNAATVQFVHRWLGLLFLGALVIFLIKVKSLKPNKNFNRLTWALLSMTVVQIYLGVFTLLSGMNFYVALAHQGGALLLFALALSTLYIITDQYEICHTRENPVHLD